ncbi:MAG: CCA tRNA nucleotidyltransferase [Candidatus Margulisiibacteriota bacterium]
MKKILAGALKIIKTLQGAGFECYLVGGCVRDALLRKKIAEWDLTTSATPAQMIKLFKKAVPTGIKYGTVTVILPDGHRQAGVGKYEVTTFRSEEKYSDGRHPDRVHFTKSLTADLARRDFTINAMAYDPVSKTLVDIFGGKKDLQHKIIRAVGNPVDRFKEDGLRALRACRFAAKLNFKIEPKTFAAIAKTLSVAKKVAVERIQGELLKIMETEHPSIAIELMRKSGLLKIIMPELTSCFGVRQPRPYHRYDVYWHSLYSMDAAPQTGPVLRLAALLHDISKPECKKGMTFYNHNVKGEKKAEKILRRLKFSNAHIQKITNLVRNHMFEYQDEWGDAAIRRFIRRVGKDNIEDLFAVRAADSAAMSKTIGLKYLKKLRRRIQKALKEDHALKVTDLALNGHDIIKALKINPGPVVGQALNYLLEKVLDQPELNTKSKLIELLKHFHVKKLKEPRRGRSTSH